MNFVSNQFEHRLKINGWTNQLKMSFNLGPTNQAHKVILSRKIKNISHLPLNFDKNFVKQVMFSKHLGLYLDCKMDFHANLQKHL